ncbi:three component ABC system middle component [Streptomyces griseus]|uniref:Three component ABC system middle component n=1 Tax=Streptomyces atroolivaceus TaxID=66869 RepID=A0ABV9VIG9_STRAZ|nr:three component ABC system middle component [Streptomyces atroolivaceus]
MTTPPTGQIRAPAAETAWNEPAALVAAMLNPALIANLLFVAADAYTRRQTPGMPWALSFIIAPMALHQATREALPAGTRTHLSAWIGHHPVLRAGFPRRAKVLVAPVRAGLRFALGHDMLELHRDCLRASTRPYTPPPQDTEMHDILRSARLIGRWLAENETAAVFAGLGVGP